jgi:hypothetical protein
MSERLYFHYLVKDTCTNNYNNEFSLSFSDSKAPNHGMTNIQLLRGIKVCKCMKYLSGKTINYTYPECVFVALGTQHEMRMRHMLTVACPSLTCFSTLYKNGTSLEKCHCTENICFYSLQILSKNV